MEESAELREWLGLEPVSMVIKKDRLGINREGKSSGSC